MCIAWGDPHYKTFDKSGWHTFMGKCKYVASESVGVPSNSNRWFRIVAENEVRFNRTAVSYLKEVTLYLDGGNTVIVIKKGGVVTVRKIIFPILRTKTWRYILFGITSMLLRLIPRGH